MPYSIYRTWQLAGKVETKGIQEVHVYGRPRGGAQVASLSRDPVLSQEQILDT